MKNQTEKDPYEGLSDAQRAKEFLQNMPVHSSYEPVPGIPIPMNDGVLVKQVATELVTVGSIVLSEAANSIRPKTGIVYAIGPGCPDHIKVGTKWQFMTDEGQQRPYATFYHMGTEYTAINTYHLLYALPDETTTIYGGVKSDKAMSRIKRVERQKNAFKADKIRDDEFKNKSTDKTKGKIRPVSR